MGTLASTTACTTAPTTASTTASSGPSSPAPASGAAPLIQVEGLVMCYGELTVMENLHFDVHPGEVLAIVGPSGCGKSTLLRHLVGLQRPGGGHVRHGGVDLAACDDGALARLQRRLGVLYQDGALWSTMSVGENLMLPLRLFSGLDEAQCERRARFKLAQVGLEGSFHAAPGALSGGMRKRAAVARAMVLDPPLLFLDEPSAGLDPLSNARLDSLILDLRRQFGTTVVMVTHDITSLFATADRALFLDPQEKTMTALDAPRTLLEHGPESVREFLGQGLRQIVPSAALPAPAPAPPP